MDIKKLKYTKDHEWIQIENNIATVGITAYAQESLGEIVYVDLPELDKKVEQQEVLGSLESIKAVSDIFSPVVGKVIEVNNSLENEPNKINEEPYSAGWIVKLEMDSSSSIEELLDYDAYQKFIED